MNGKTIESVPLTEDEKAFLLMVYRKRLALLSKAYAVLLVIVLLTASRGLDTRSRISGKIVRWEQKDDAKYISRLGMYVLNCCFIGGVLLSTAFVIYRRRIRTVRIDAESGMKERVPYTISRKQYFPLTGQYFVWIDDPDNLDHEVDEETYFNCAEGDTIYVYRAARSKLVFEKDGRHDIL